MCRTISFELFSKKMISNEGHVGTVDSLNEDLLIKRETLEAVDKDIEESIMLMEIAVSNLQMGTPEYEDAVSHLKVISQPLLEAEDEVSGALNAIRNFISMSILGLIL